MVMEGLHEDLGGDGTMQCVKHPYKNSGANPGGICAFCLQEKLGKLVSSSFPIAVFPSSSSSSSPSFRSDYGHVVSSSSSSAINTVLPNLNGSTINNGGNQYNDYSRRTRMPFLLIQRRKKKKETTTMNINMAASSGSEQSGVVFKRSKSTTMPRRNVHFMDSDDSDAFSPRRRGGFWSFIYQSKHSASRKPFREIGYGSGTNSSRMAAVGTCNNGSMAANRSRERKEDEFVVVDDSVDSPNQASSSSMERKVSRSRSVGCGSRSFSGDLFERISTGFGDCTLRRVESQREGKPKVSAAHRGGEHDSIKERVKCGGIFGGFMMTSSSSSSYWVSSSAEDNVMNGHGRAPPPGTVAGANGAREEQELGMGIRESDQSLGEAGVFGEKRNK